MKKRLIFLLLCLCCIPLFTACKTASPYLSATSELCSMLYFGETETLAVTALTGKRENPYLSDGIKEETYPFFTVSVKIKGEYSAGEEFGISANIGGETFSCDLTFSPLGDKLTGSFPVKSPATEKEIALTVYRGGESQTVPLTSPESLCPYENALTASAAALGKDVAVHLSHGSFTGEIHARLTRVQSVTYWFITFIPKNGEICSALTDARTGEVLAVKGVTPTPSPTPTA